ncbi:MAG: DEAD/DEAH box helicase [Thermoplasmata archaeon]
MADPPDRAQTSSSESDPASLESLGVDPAIRAILAESGIRRLYPPQAAAIPHVLAGRNVLLACPTASGKSLVAYLALLRAVRMGRRGLYMVPLRALAREKAEELRAFEPLGIRIGVSIGDFDLRPEQLEGYDILVATSEKADALLRRGSPWIGRLGVVVADEVHLLRDPDRGPTLEITLTRLRGAEPEPQIVALSATVGNTAEVGAWLDAEVIESDFRPVPLRRGVYSEGRILFTDLTTRDVPGIGEPVPRLVRDVVREGGQAIVFVSTRRASEQGAQALVPAVRPLLTEPERAAAAAAASDLATISEEETEGLRRLSSLLPHGVAFHNASLTNGEREVVERAFRDGRIKALVATPTLAAGINLPARRVIVRDTYRYDDRLGMQAPIPALEIQQMCGRAGRPRYDPVGEAILIARDPEQEERYLDTYLSAPPEDVESRLAAEPALRMHVLALAASGAVTTERQLEAFFRRTFYGRTLPWEDLVDRVDSVRRFLVDEGFLVASGGLAATPFGRLTSELYLDPMSALVLRQILERAPLGVRSFPLLAGVCAAPDLPPIFLRRVDESALTDRFVAEEPELLVRPEEPPLRLDFESFLSTMKTAAILEAWIDETPIVTITDRFGIGAGDLRAKVEDAEWLLFGLARLARAFQPRLMRAADDLSLRVRYGAGEELLDLVRLRGIGRVRARALFRAGYGDREALRRAPVDRLEQILRSPRLVTSVLEQVGGSVRSPGAPGRGEPSPPGRPSAGRQTRTRRSRPLEEYPDGSEG